MINSYYETFIYKLTRYLGRKPSKSEIVRFAFDGFCDYFAYGSTIGDYFELNFPKLTVKQKRKYLTFRSYNKFVAAFDTTEEIRIHDNKKLEYEKLKQFMARDQLFSKECSKADLAEFINANPVFLYKPNVSSQGRGIQKINSKDYTIDALYDFLTKAPAVLDSLVIQHSEMNRICPGSVNTIRIVTVKLGDLITIVGAALRTGSGTSLVDNYSAGGYVCAIDINTGVVVGDGQDHSGKTYITHPYTNVAFKGFKIPNWDMVIVLVQDAAMAYDLNIVGWDIAIRQNDAVVIEANDKPGIHVYQIAGNEGKKEIFDELYRKKTGRKL